MKNIVIERSMGKSNDWKEVKGLMPKDIEILNGIGYGSVKDKGTVSEYLNSLNNGYKYSVSTINSNVFECTDRLLVSYCKVFDE